MVEKNEFEIKLGGLPDATYLHSNSIFIHSSLFAELSKKFDNQNSFMYVQLKGVIVKVEHKSDEKLIGIVAIGKVKKEQLKLLTDEMVKMRYLPSIKVNLIVQAYFTIIYNSKKNNLSPEVKEEDLEAAIRSSYSAGIFNVSDRIYVEVLNKDSSVKVIIILELTKMLSSDENIISIGSLVQETTLDFTYSSNDMKIVNSSKTKKIMKQGGFNFQDMGVGGMHDEINKIYRTAFVSRMHSAETLKKFGIKHVKGVLLYGPPGTGKTLIAKTLAKMLDSEECTIVNGPELFDKYVGETERKIRELFAKAEKDEKDNGENAGLHVIVFDEIDSICRARGTISSGTGVHDSAVNQLLTKIDGVNSLNNILIIGMTNRKELIDEAILRPGRLEVHVEIGLPTLMERIEIFKVHTKPMRENDILDKNLSLEELAKQAENFTGAEIETLVKRASSYAMNCFNMETLGTKKGTDVKYSKITVEHFKYAFDEVKPQFGTDKELLESPVKFGIINYGARFIKVQNQITSYVSQLKNSISANLMSILLCGDSGNGKTSLACDIALNSGFPYVKIISPQQLVRLSEQGKAQEIVNIFENAYKSPLSFIVLDNIERIIEYIKIGPRFSNSILQTLLVYITKSPLNKNHKLFIIGTTNIIGRLDDLELVSVFNHKIEIPSLKPDEIESVIEKYPDVESSLKGDISKLYKSNEALVPIKELIMTLDECIQVKGKGFSFQDFEEIYNLKKDETLLKY